MSGEIEGGASKEEIAEAEKFNEMVSEGQITPVKMAEVEKSKSPEEFEAEKAIHPISRGEAEKYYNSMPEDSHKLETNRDVLTGEIGRSCYTSALSEYDTVNPRFPGSEESSKRMMEDAKIKIELLVDFLKGRNPIESIMSEERVLAYMHIFKHAFQFLDYNPDCYKGGARGGIEHRAKDVNERWSIRYEWLGPDKKKTEIRVALTSKQEEQLKWCRERAIQIVEELEAKLGMQL